MFDNEKDNMKLFRILIIDDHQLIIDSLHHIIDNLEFTSLIEQAKDLSEAYNKTINTINQKKWDLIIMDLQLPVGIDSNCKLKSGIELGICLKNKYPITKIIVLTSHSNEIIFSEVIKKINPEGFLLKNDIDHTDVKKSIKKLLFNNEQFFSKDVNAYLLKKERLKKSNIDDYDLKILIELSQGGKLKELRGFIPLSKSGIEKRIRRLKDIFEIESRSNRDLIQVAKEKGVIL